MKKNESELAGTINRCFDAAVCNVFVEEASAASEVGGEEQKDEEEEEEEE